MTVDTGDAAGVGQIMEPLLSALRALTNTVNSGEGEGEDEGGEETVLVGADRLVLGLLSTVRVSSVSLAVRHHEEESLVVVRTGWIVLELELRHEPSLRLPLD